MDNYGPWTAKIRGGFIDHGLRIGAMSMALLCGTAIAHGGPCTAQIAELTQQLDVTPSGPESGPTAPQTLGAQLHRQPTPGTVEHGERVANNDADAALERARKADAEGNAVDCAEALKQARLLYGIY